MKDVENHKLQEMNDVDNHKHQEMKDVENHKHQEMKDDVNHKHQENIKCCKSEAMKVRTKFTSDLQHFHFY